MGVKCPTCGREIEWSDRSPFRPFCSERCKLVDLGKWLGEEYRVPAKPPQEGDEQEGVDLGESGDDPELLH